MRSKVLISTVFAAALAACTALCACSEKPAPEKQLPEVNYGIGETVPELNANDNSFSVASVTADEDSQLKDLTIYWLGSSVTYGASSQGESMADFLAAMTGCTCVKEAVSGTTIFDDGGNGDTGVRSYTRRLVNGSNFDKNQKIDAFICQISTNDARNDRLTKRGDMTGEDEMNIAVFDRTTTLGGVEYIIAYVKEVWDCPIYFYSGGYFDDDGVRKSANPTGTNYGKLVEEVKQITEKWRALGVETGVIDLFNDSDFNSKASDDYYKWCMNDAIHPRRAGYLQWWTPYFENFLTIHLVMGEPLD